MAVPFQRRVIVHLTDYETDEEKPAFKTKYRLTSGSDNTNSFQNSHIPLPRDIKASMEAYDNKTLVLTYRSKNAKNNSIRDVRQMHFDRVDRGNNIDTNAELTVMLDHLLIENENCCLVRVRTARECPAAFLSNLVVTEIEKRFQQWQCTLQSIKIENLDVKKYNVENFMSYTSVRGKGKRYFKPRSLFNNMPSLRKWFQDDYTALFALGSGHDFLDMTFIFTDAQRTVHKVKLMIVHLFITKMDTGGRNSLCGFLENVNSEKKIKHTLLTGFLREFFVDTAKWHTWLIYDIPTRNISAVVVTDMLKMATAAYSGGKLQTNSRKLKQESDRESTEVLIDTTKYERPKPLTLPVIQRNNNISKTPNNVDKPKNEVLNNLTEWYKKIDCRFGKVIESLETFNNFKYESKVRKMCCEISEMMRNIDMDESKNPNEGRGTHGTNSMRDLKFYYQQYANALGAFKVLTTNIEKSKYGSILKVYIDSKNMELKNHEILLKVRQLELCHNRLTGTIKNEAKCLNDARAVSHQLSNFQKVIK